MTTLSITPERQHQVQYIKTTTQDSTYNIKKHLLKARNLYNTQMPQNKSKYSNVRALYLRLQASFVPVFSIVQSVLTAQFLKKILINNAKGKSIVRSL